MSHQSASAPTYFKTFIALLIMTVVTVAVAQVDFGALNTLIAVAIATVKAVLVAAIFMGCKYDDKLYSVILIGSVFFLVLMYFLSAVDIATRIPLESTL